MTRRFSRRPTRLELEIARSSNVPPAIRLASSFLAFISSGFIGLAAVVMILIFLVPLAIPFAKNLSTFPLIGETLTVEKAVFGFFGQYLEQYKDKIPFWKELIRWPLVAFFLFMIRWAYSLKNRHRRRMIILRALKQYDELKAQMAQMHLADSSEVLRPIEQKLEEIGNETSTENREELLKLFVETKKKLDAMGRDLAFLAIDVVDSTGMKQGEEKATCEHDFKEYKKYVEKKIEKQGALKSAWTPDGVMVCFPTVDAAVRAARDVINGLGAFNKNVKLIKCDFKVRCGINHGFVYFDESVPMEEMSDRVIDIAGHMQKHASPNTICIAKPAIEPVDEKEGFQPASKIVDGYEVYVWTSGDTGQKKQI